MKKVFVVLCAAVLLIMSVIGFCSCGKPEKVDVEALLAQCTQSQTYDDFSFDGGKFSVNLLTSSVYVRTEQCNAVTLSYINNTFDVSASGTSMIVREHSESRPAADKFVIITVPAAWSGYTVSLNSQKGNIQADGLDAMRLEVRANGNSAVYLQNCKAVLMMVTVVNGYADIDADASTAIFVATGKRGNAVINSRGDFLDARSINGKIDFTTDAASISLQSERGAITGTVRGNFAQYSVDAVSEHGKCNLVNQNVAGNHGIVVRTSRGNVQIEFDNGAD